MSQIHVFEHGLDSKGNPHVFYEDNTPILEFQGRGWCLYYMEADGNGAADHWIGGELKDRDWAIQQAENWLLNIGPRPIYLSPLSRERRARDKARRMGLRLMKSRSRNIELQEFGTYQLVDGYTNTLVAYSSQNGYGLSLEEIEDALNDEGYR